MFYASTDYLKSLGAAIVDTPGLNMSYNDTESAMLAMSAASAIFYFFRGEKQLSAEEMESLHKIREQGLADKVFFGINFRTKPSTIRKSGVEETILGALESAGYTKEHQRTLLYFNAFLAQRGEQGRLLMAGTLDEISKARLLEDERLLDESDDEPNAQPTDADYVRAWVTTTNDVMTQVKAEGYRDFEAEGLSEEGIQHVMRASNWEQVVQTINTYVFKNKARALLVDQIAKPVQNSLEAVATEMTAREQAASRTAAQLQDLYDDATSLYSKFKLESKKIIEQYIDKSWDDVLAEDFFNKVIIPSAEDAAKAAAPKLEQLNTFGVNAGHIATQVGNFFTGIIGIKNKSHLELETSAIIQMCVEDAIKARSIRWFESLESTDTYRNIVLNNVNSVEMKMRALWQQLSLSQNSILNGYATQLYAKLPKGTFMSDAKSVSLSQDSLYIFIGANDQMGGYLDDILAGAGAGLGIAAGLAGLYMYVLPLDFIVPFAGDIIAGIALLVSAIVSAFCGESRREAHQKETMEKLAKTLREEYSNPDKKKEILYNLINGDGRHKGGGMKLFRNFYKGAFESVIGDTEKNLKAAGEKAEKDARESERERQRIAAEARSIRASKIDPITAEIANIIAQAESIWPDN